MLNNFSIKARLALFLIGTFLFGTIVVLLNIRASKIIKTDVLQVTDGSLVQLKGASDLNSLLLTIQSEMSDSLLDIDVAIHHEDFTEDHSDDLINTHSSLHDETQKIIIEEKEKINRLINDFETRLQEVRSAGENQTKLITGENHEYSQNVKRIEQLIEVLREFSVFKKNILNSLDMIDTNTIDAINHFEKVAEPHFQENLLPLVENYFDNELTIASDEGADVILTIENNSLIIQIISIIVSILLIVVYILVSKSITNPLQKLVDTFRDISQGNLKTKAVVKGKNEISQLAAEFNLMSNILAKQTKATQASQEKLLASIINLPLGFILIDKKSHILLNNPMIKKIFNFTNDKWNIKSINEKLGNKLDLIKISSKVIKTGTSIKLKDIKLSNEKHLTIDAVPVISQEKKAVSSVVFILQDVTEEKKLNQTRDEFFALASHELRTPLTSIRGNISLIQDHFANKIKNPDFKNMIDDIHTSSIRLIGIVQDFLDVSQLEQKRIEFNIRDFKIDTLIKKSIREIEKNATKKGLSIKLEGELSSLPEVHADEDKTYQIFINLLGNAVKFTEKGSIKITVTLENNMIKISVTDSGIGIKNENQKMLFKKFTQATGDHLTRDATHGSGLGLYISKLLIEGMKGKITLEKSQPEEGSTFTFTLPTAKINVKKRDKKIVK